MNNFMLLVKFTVEIQHMKLKTNYNSMNATKTWHDWFGGTLDDTRLTKFETEFPMQILKQPKMVPTHLRFR